jgi:hypothetical protein
VQRDEYKSDATSASLLVIPEQVFDTSPGGTATVDAPSIEPKMIPEYAAWTATARVLFNLDDFMTRE